MQSLCVLGYCIFPLDLAAFIALFVRLLWIRIPICAGAFAWSVWGMVVPARQISVSEKRRNADSIVFVSFVRSCGQLLRRHAVGEGSSSSCCLSVVHAVLPACLDDNAVLMATG